MSVDPSKIETQIKDAQSGQKGLPPIDQWNPELSGDIDIRIQRDGIWLYQGEPLKREAIARIFSTILRREEDGAYYLVTPVEKWRIQVDDTPLLAHSLEVRMDDSTGQVLSVTTNMGETLDIGPDHPLTVGTYDSEDEPRPVVAVRHGLEARVVTSAFYELANYVEEREHEGRNTLCALSKGHYFSLG
ncbi:DUF1285 domain-containing protein [Marinobacter zhejiangensis]|uniref:DUF1285 domain-containing protein n=1 Tax=Marinobacter zhejiangensis TaxID=488535 RepID=A0A1I4RWX7_9GAMM|nr:DUF1285 domain-containing protein [Marinobacter zhejiangensis]SFM56786.1 hypothetical protein SAMN04487963_3001 [Marinobacter zhejiangensis]